MGGCGGGANWDMSLLFLGGICESLIFEIGIYGSFTPYNILAC